MRPFTKGILREWFGNWFQNLLFLILLCSTVLFIFRTWHWPLVGDAPLIHYVVFLISHGKIPYRDIVDINMPGTYAIQGFVIHFFGGGALAWRIFDLFLCASVVAAMTIIARPYNWFAGVFAGVIFTLIHGRDGLIELGQRDLMMAALVLLGYVFLFHDLHLTEEKHSPLWTVMLFTLCIGLAATIKPTILPLGPALLLFVSVIRAKKGLPFLSALLAGTICFILPWGIAFIYLFHKHAISAFFSIVLYLIPQHADLRQRSSAYLLLHCISSVLLPLVIMWLPVAYFRRFWATRQGVALLIGIMAGFISFYVQGKGFPYHRYPSETLLLLLMGIDLSVALKQLRIRFQKPIHLLIIVALVYGVVVIGADSAVHAIHFDWRNDEFDTMLQSDLVHLGGRALDGRVQCLDMGVGCLNVLYRMKLLQSTGFLYDCYLFMPPENSTVESLRQKFWDEIMTEPPKVFVITSHRCGLSPRNYRYNELLKWPEFNSFLTDHYKLYADRIPPHKVHWVGVPIQPFGYRIYVRNNLE